MSDKQSFLEKLRAALIKRSVSEADMAQYIDQFDRFYERMAADSETAAGVFDDVEGIADNIAAQVSEKSAKSAPTPDSMNETVQTVSVHTQIIDASEVEILSADSSEMEAVSKDGGETATPADEVDSEHADEPATSDTEPQLAADASSAPHDIRAAEDESEKTHVQKEPIAHSDVKKREVSTSPSKPIRKRTISGNKLFWVLLFATLPITVPLAAAVFALFVGVWLALIGVIVGAVAALVGVCALGAAAALIGIIYGVTQIGASMPVALYEIGVGVIVSGVTMFFGILIYNFAIRLLPLFIKLVFKLFKFVLVKLKELFNYLRKECAKL